jgi:hypothetical protein
MTKEIKATATKKQGRPVNPNSERQARLKAQAELKAHGVEIKRGRPVEETSARQARLALKGKVALGRKVNPNSERQQRLAALELKRASGVEVKRGRPKMVKATDDAGAE